MVNYISAPHISPTLCYLWCALLVIFRRSISTKTPNSIVSKLEYGQPYSVHLNTYCNHMDESAIWEIIAQHTGKSHGAKPSALNCFKWNFPKIALSSMWVPIAMSYLH